MTRGHALRRSPDVDAPMPVELFLTVFAELEDALQWTIESLTDTPTGTGTGTGEDAARLPHSAGVVRKLLASSPPEGASAPPGLDGIIWRCLELARFHGRVLAATPPRLTSSVMHEHARKAIVLTADVLGLHVLRSPHRAGSAGAGQPRL